MELAVELITAQLSDNEVRRQAKLAAYEELSTSPQLHADVTSTLSIVAARFALDAGNGDVGAALEHVQACAIRLRSGFED